MVSRVASVLACLSFAWADRGQQAQEAGRSAAGARRTGSCDCLEFAAVYYDNLASCGRAHELYFATKYGASAAYHPTEPIAGLPHQICANFFKNFKNNSCVNVDLFPFPSDNNDNLSGQQWCYVANDCLNLNGGTFATNHLGFAIGGWHNQISTSNLSVKMCDSNTDDILKDMTIEQLDAIGSESDVSMAYLLRLAYPAVQVDWGEARLLMEAINQQIESATNSGLTITLTDAVAGVTAPNSADPPAGWGGTRLLEVDGTIRSIVTSEQGTILDGLGHMYRDEFHVIVGRAVYEVARIDPPYDNMAYLAGKFYSEFEVRCVLGCSPSTREAPLDLLTQ
jgi:hypothetical protein